VVEFGARNEVLDVPPDDQDRLVLLIDAKVHRLLGLLGKAED
jgi:hypothetical protein